MRKSKQRAACVSKAGVVRGEDVCISHGLTGVMTVARLQTS